MKALPLYVAVHEAGHAISMLAQDPPRWVDYISIKDIDGGNLGFTASKARFQFYLAEQLDKIPGQREALESAAWSDIVDLLAGPIAELRFRRYSAVARGMYAAQVAKVVADENFALVPDDDFAKVRLRLRWRISETVARDFLKAWEEADNVVSEHWKSVEVLGRWLYRQRYIDDEELWPWWEARRSALSSSRL